ncbi:Guanine nucleotide-binding 3 like protein [Lentinula edodes]|uniref:Guanine nucleotide-binding 3 like protein n=1 Tax=Lentinula edodes TaxID=5353 RepID=A0A1Q3EIU6_LENED|nr:Guanine nucleotide-binding 3 like protein [Lentinula edodes]
MTMGRTKHRKPIVPLKSKLKKDPGIPKLPDIKQRNELRQRARPSIPTHRSDPDCVMASEPTLSSLAQLASNAEDAFDFSQNQDPGSSTGKTKEQIRKHYLRTLHKVIDQSDIIILVLDARDPEGCRSRLVEEEVRRRESEGKKLVFVLNKVDLIPRANAQAWLKHLRHNTPTLPFLSPSSAQHQRTNISSSTAPSLLKLLKAYKPKAGSVTVGVVGYPNVGKSSLINSLKRNKVCAVAAQPGHTKELQSVQLERGMRIVDSPGVVFDEDDEDFKGQKKGSVLLRNVVKVEDVDDPIAVVEEILIRTEKETMRKIYSLPDYNATLEFLTMLALSSGRLLKGGTPDITSAARQVITDWNHQKIPYCSVPPTIHPSSIPSTIPSSMISAVPNFSTAPDLSGSAPGQAGQIIAPGAENVGHAQILSSFSEPFELEGLFGAADAGAFGGGRSGPDVNMDAEGDGDDMFWDANETLSNENADDGMQEGDATISASEFASRRTSLGKHLRSPSPSISVGLSQPHEPSNVQLRQAKRHRKSHLIPSYDAPPDAHVLREMGKSNPMNRRMNRIMAKKERKKERKLSRHVIGEGTAGGMEVDDSANLGLTFMA